MLATIEQKAVPGGQAGLLHGAAARMVAGSGDPLPDARAGPLSGPPSGVDNWLLAAHAWGGLRVMLRVLALDAEGAMPSRRRLGTLALRMTLTLPGLGSICVQLQLAADGVLLDLVAEQTEALQPLRDRLPDIVAAINRADLRVLRCRLMRGWPGTASSQGMAALPAPAVAIDGHRLNRDDPTRMPLSAALPPALFTAAVEVALTLST
jgi:hypothetical protein